MSGIVWRQGDLLVVPHGARLAPICVDCATRDGVAPRIVEMSHVPTRARVIAASVTVIGWLACLAALESRTLAFLLPLLFGANVVLARLTRRGLVTLPVCATCDVRWARAARAKNRAAFALLPVTAVAGASLFVLPSAIAVPFGATLIGSSIAALAFVPWLVERRLALVAPASIDRDAIRLRGVHPDARRELAAAELADGAYR